MAKVTRGGTPTTTNGELPAVGSTAPDFTLVDKDLNNVTLADFKGKKKLLNIVVSLDTGFCADSTKKFNDALGARKDVAVLVISADLPFAQARVCSANNSDKVTTLSMMRDRHFAKDYGVLIQDGPLEGLTARSVVVLDENNKVLYSRLSPEIGQEPDYEPALAALK
jgi:thiol peroxidase